MKLTIKWVKDEDRQFSLEGRFCIEPCYLGRCTPVSYTLEDSRLQQCHSDLTITECKEIARDLARETLRANTGRSFD